MKILVDDMPKKPEECVFATGTSSKDIHTCNVPRFAGMICNVEHCPALIEWYESAITFPKKGDKP